MKKLLVGILVGGKATRLSGVVKGMLAAPDGGEPLAARLARVCREGAPDADVVLLGESSAYTSLHLPSLTDDPPGIGPLGALGALFSEAAARGSDALAVAADLPYVTTDMVILIRRHTPDAAAVAPRPGGTWQPLFARYSPAACLPIARSLVAEKRYAARGVLDALGDLAVPLPPDAFDERLLDDWDTPEDVARSR